MNAALTLLVLWLLQAATAAPPTGTITHPFEGVTFVDRAATAPRAVRMRVVQIDLGAEGIRFKLSPRRGAQEVIRERTLDYLKREGAQIAINVHYFWPFPSPEVEAVIIGIGASEGDAYSAFESPVQSYALVADAPGINLDRNNHASLVRRDPSASRGDRTAEGVALWNTVAGSAQIVTAGVVTIPDYADTAHPGGTLTPGGPNRYDNARSWYEAINARTAIGLSRDGHTLTLFTVDARGGSAGLTVREMAGILVTDYGVWNALNLDGGGSTSFAMEDPVTHVPTLLTSSSDSPEGRAVGSSLAVFARPRR